MAFDNKKNSFALFLKEQGVYVLSVDGVDWYEYQGFMIPAYLPHCIPDISSDLARKVQTISGRPFVRWESQFNNVESASWWYVLKEGKWAMEEVKDKKKRWMIRQGRKNFTVRPLTYDQAKDLCYDVGQRALSRYEGEANVESKEELQMCVEAGAKFPGVLEYIGCFHDDLLVSYAENYIQGNAVWMAVIRNDPAFLKKYSSYGLMDGLLDYYLNEKKMRYVLDGNRSIHHRTEFQDHLEKIYGFSKHYVTLEIVYSKKLAAMVRIAYPVRGIVWALSKKWSNHFIDNVGSILRQEQCRKTAG